jgi:hypothetical protein
LLTPIAKGWSTEISQEITSLGVQIHGGMGFVEETGAAQFLRDARITTIYEGTTGIQANDLIGRKLIRDQGLEFGRLIADIRETQTQVAALGDDMATIASSLAQGADSLQEVANWVIDHHQDNPQLPGAVAVNFLMAAGTVLGGWLLAKGAVVASAKMADDKSFYGAKIITARFYAEQIMPRAAAHVKMAESGSAMTMALADDQF